MIDPFERQIEFTKPKLGQATELLVERAGELEVLQKEPIWI